VVACTPFPRTRSGNVHAVGTAAARTGALAVLARVFRSVTFYVAPLRVAGVDPDAIRGLDAVAFLAGTPVRVCALERSRTARARGRRSGRPPTPPPRTTLRRNLAALEERGLIEHDPAADEYALTAAGERAWAAIGVATDALAGATGVGTFLRQFPGDPPI